LQKTTFYSIEKR